MTETPCAPTPVRHPETVPLLNFFTALLPVSAIYSTGEAVMWYDTPSGADKPVLTIVVNKLEVGCNQRIPNK